MMHQLSCISTFIILLIVLQSYLYLSHDALVVAVETALDISIDMFGPGDKNWQAITAAAEQNEEIRTRLQQHVATQVNKLIHENQLKNNNKQNNNDNVDLVDGGQHQLELKLELPADLATLVNKHYAGKNAISGHNTGTLKFKRNANGEIGELKDISDVGVSVVNVGDSVVESLPNNNNEEGEALFKVSHRNANVDKSFVRFVNKGQLGDNNEGGIKPSSSSTNTKATTNKASNTATLCPLGTYSKTGYSTSSDLPCRVCPEGQTTLKLGSTSCQVLTEEDILVMLYDFLQGKYKMLRYCFIVNIELNNCFDTIRLSKTHHSYFVSLYTRVLLI